MGKARYLSTPEETSNDNWDSAYVSVMPLVTHKEEFEVVLPTTNSQGGRFGNKVLRPLSVGGVTRRASLYTLRDAATEVNLFLQNFENRARDDLRNILEVNNGYRKEGKSWNGIDLVSLE